MNACRKILALTFCVFLILSTAGCGPAAPQATMPNALPTAKPTAAATATVTIPVETVKPSVTLPPTPTDIPPTEEPTATEIPIPTMAPYVGTSVPQENLAPISLTNYRELRQVGHFYLEYEHLQDEEGESFYSDVVFSPNSRFLGYLDGVRLVLWDLPGQKIERTFTVECCGLGPGIVFSPNSRWVATNGHEGPIVWDVNTGEMVSRGIVPVVDLTITDMRYLQDYNALIFSRDGRQIITGSYYASTSVTFWDAQTGKIIRDTFPTWNGINDLAISPDGKTIYAAVRSGQLNTFDAVTGELVEFMGDGVCLVGGEYNCAQMPYQACREGIGTVEVTPNGKILALQCQPKDIEFAAEECTELESGSPLSREHRRDICFNTKLYSTETWKFLGYLNEITPALGDITFNSDGGIAAQAVGSPVSQVKFWNTVTHEELYTIEGFPGVIAQAAFSPNGKLLLVRLKGGETLLFGVPK